MLVPLLFSVLRNELKALMFGTTQIGFMGEGVISRGRGYFMGEGVISWGKGLAAVSFSIVH